MTTPHPLKEIINAIADGIAIEVRLQEDTHWIAWHREMMTPIDVDAEDYEWRIKSEPKPDFVLHFNESWAREVGRRQWLFGDRLKVTFDGETHKLIKAEVI
jgi:hypothetical protein